jgi:hypothetical protein
VDRMCGDCDSGGRLVEYEVRLLAPVEKGKLPHHWLTVIHRVNGGG